VISAARVVAAPPDRVFEFLAHLPNHWQLDAALAEVDATSETTADVRLQGPFGIARVAHTEVLEAVPPSRLRGRAVVGGTVGHVAWDLEPADGGTRVRLSTEIARAAPRDAAVLALGGQWWLRRVYARALANLAFAVEA
jgi:uncharacterized protein YndB with AHSA1/START domain